MATKGKVMKQEFKILLLESTEGSAELVEFELSLAAIRFTLERVTNHESYFRALQEFNPHLILADGQVRLPEGLTALALAREVCPEVPFLYVSGDMRPMSGAPGVAALVQNGPKLESWPQKRSFWRS